MLNKCFGKFISKTKAVSKSMLSIVLVLCLLAVMLPAGLIAAGATTSWDGTMEPFENYNAETAETDFALFDSTGGQAYEIANPKQLAFLAAIVRATGSDKTDKTDETTFNKRRYTVLVDADGDGNKETYYFPGNRYGFLCGVTFKLVADIDLAGQRQPWTPISSFGGHFDGNGHKIENLYVNSTANFVGLFNTVAYGSVKNLTVYGSVTTTQAYAGGIVGRLGGGASLMNCAFIGDVAANSKVGGLVGGTASYTGTGGADFAITNCWTSGTVTAKSTSSSAAAVGGLLGSGDSTHNGTVVITNCYSTMTVATRSSKAPTEIYGAAGLCGDDKTSGTGATYTFNNCYFAGAVNTSYPIANPFNSTTSVTNCFYQAGSYVDTAGGVGIADSTAIEVSATDFVAGDNSLAKRLNAGVKALKAAGAEGISYWKIAADGIPSFAISPKVLGLSISCGSIVFEPTKPNYTLFVPNAITSTTVTTTVEDATTTTITVNDEAVENGTPSQVITLAPNETTTITVSVTRDGVTETYIIEVVCTAAWDGSIATGYAGGDGTQDSPYLIETPEQLAYLAQQANADKANTLKKYFKLTSDIDLGNLPWTPIGDATNTFAGHFDGDGHTIKRMNCTNTITNTDVDLGLFGVLYEASVKNLHIVESKVDAGSIDAGKGICAGGIAGRVTAITKLYNCSFDGEIITSGTGNGNRWVGGLVGKVYGRENTIIGCSATGTINAAKKAQAGGLIGYAFGTAGSGYGLSIVSSYSAMTMDVSALTDSWSQAGGLIGSVSDASSAISVRVLNSFLAGTINNAYPITSSTINITVGDDVYLKEGWYTGTDNVTVGGAGIDAANPTARVKSVPAFTTDGTVKGLLAATATTGVAWSIGTNHPTVTYTEPAGGSTPLPPPPSEPEKEPNIKPEPFANYKEENAGTKENPYKIANAKQLYFLSKTTQIKNKDDIDVKVALTIGGIDYHITNYKGKYFVLTADIDWKNETWLPIGGFDYSTAFRAHFDGAGHKISNINCSTSQAAHIGFFGTIAEVTIKNLSIVSATYKHDRTNYVPTTGELANVGFGGVAGMCGEGTSFINVHFDGDIVVTSNGNWNTYVGGILAFATGKVKVAGCSATGSITSARRCVGGLVGNCYASGATPSLAEISGSYSAMDIVCTATGTTSVGGLFGSASEKAGPNAVKLINCHFAGTINKPYPISQSVSTIMVEDDVFYIEGCYTGTDGAVMGGAGIDATNPNARERSVADFENGTVTNLLNLTAIGETSWKNGANYPVNVTSQSDALVTNVMMSGAAILFSPSTYTYDLEVPYSTDSLVVKPVVVENAAAFVNGVSVPAGSVSKPFNLKVGVTQKIYLQAKRNGAINTYLFKVTRREKTPNGIWDGGYEPFDTSNGKGTDLDNPILIKNASQLAFLAAMVNGKSVMIGETVYTPPAPLPTSPVRYYSKTYFKLVADIKLNALDNYENWDAEAPLNKWEPIGYYIWNNTETSRIFDGILDGDGHTISGLYVSMGADKYENGAGLFGAVGGATIRNLHVKQSYVQGWRSVGGMVGRVNGSSTTGYLTMQNCSYSGIVKSFAAKDARTGGMIGSVWPGTTLNSCWTEGKVSGGSYLGGLVGYAQLQKPLDIRNSYSAMTVESTAENPESTGGLVGGFVEMTGSFYVRRSHFAGFVNTNTPLFGSKHVAITGATETLYYREGSYVGNVNEELLFDAVEYSAEEFADGTVTELLNQLPGYSDFWNWEDGENGYPVSDGVILITDFRTHTDDSNFGNSTAWADKFLIGDGGILKNPNGGSVDAPGDSDVGDTGDKNPITGESPIFIVAIVLFLTSAASVSFLARKRRREN